MQPAFPCPASRREARQRERRDTIVETAAQSFLENGYAGTTMSGVAATLGGSKGTLWSYFGSKEALFRAVIDRTAKAYRTGLSAILDPCGELRPTLQRFCEGLMRKVTSEEALALHRLVVAESGRFPEVGRIFYESAPLPTHRLLADFLAGAMRRGQLIEDEPLRAARLLVGLCLSGCHQQLLIGLIETAGGEQIASDIDVALTVFLRAFEAPSRVTP